MKNQEIKELIRRMEDLPTLPSVAVKIINVLLDETSSARDVAEIVEADHSLTMKLLMVANSAFYGTPRGVSTVKEAIVSLGFNKLKSMILSLSVLDTVEAMASESELDIQEFWAHSLRCAVCVEDLSRKLREDFSEEIFVAGLLHDIGKLVLSRYAPSGFREASALVRSRGMGQAEAERAIMEIDHGAVGKSIMDRWHFPVALKESVGLHHDPPLERIERDVSCRMAAIICLADMMSNARNVGLGGSVELAGFGEEVREKLGLSREEFEEVWEGLDARVSQIMEALGLEDVSPEDQSEVLQRANAELGRMTLLLRESEEKYRGIFESIQDVYAEVSVDDGTVLEISPSIEQLSGFTREEVLGESIFSFYVRPEVRRELLQALERKGSIRDYEVGFITKQREEVSCSLSVKIVTDDTGAPSKIVGTMRDITERKRAEEMQRKRERRFASVETLRQTLVTLSHYINNATAVIAGRAELCARNDPVDYQQLVDVSLSQTKRISAVLNALDKMARSMDIRTTDYAGLKNAMFDIEEELRRTLGEADSRRKI